jgi:hypothetical protein
MDLSQSVLGRGTVETLQKRVSQHLLTIGSDTFTRRDFAKVDCFSFLAAQNLSYWLNKVLKVENTRYVYFHVNPSELAIPHLGPFSLAVLGAAFELKNLGKQEGPLESWMEYHKLQVRTFNTLKINELMDGRTERKALKQRKESRRNEAHRLRVARFQKRA